jgi:cysteine-rich repeat protein
MTVMEKAVIQHLLSAIIINIIIIATFFLHQASARQKVSNDVFWDKASKTLDLKVLRQNLIDSNVVIRGEALLTDTNNPVLNYSTFLPLCGNGRLDTQADYVEYYKNKMNLPLTLPLRQIDYNNFGYRHNLPYYASDNKGNKSFNLTIFADEECDDGNRIDRDGCSADCMHKDQWTGACEIAFRVGQNENPALEYEDMIYDPIRNAMVVSAVDGLYAFRNFEYKELQPEQYYVEAQLLAPKTFPGTTLFRYRNSLILYSATQRSFWRLDDLDVGRGLTMLMNFSNAIADRSNAEWNTVAHYDPAEETVVLYNSTTMVLFNVSDMGSTTGPVPEANVRKNYCDLQGKRDYCFLHLKQGPQYIFQCEPQIQVFMRANSMCNTNPGPSGSSKYYSNLWRDTLNHQGMRSVKMKIIPYPMKYEIYPHDSNFETESANYLRMYHPMGGILEIPLFAFRFMGSRDTKYANNIFELMNYLGTPSLRKMIEEDAEVCGQDDCCFDMKIGYNPLAENPLQNIQNRSWNDVLRDIILQSPDARAMTNLTALRDNTSLYTEMIRNFSIDFDKMTKTTQVLSFEKHPQTGNLWAIQRNKIIEISSSGVKLKRKDNGKCLPVSIAVCNNCQWAENGMKCRPCYEKDTTSWAWNLKCAGYENVCAVGKRRALLQVVATTTTTINFVLQGNVTTITSMWPGNQPLLGFTDVFAMNIVSSDPRHEMTNIYSKLQSIINQVLVIDPPTVILRPPTAHNNNNNNKGSQKESESKAVSKSEEEGLNNTLVAIVAVSLILVLLVIILATIFINRYARGSDGEEKMSDRRSRHHTKSKAHGLYSSVGGKHHHHHENGQSIP